MFLGVEAAQLHELVMGSVGSEQSRGALQALDFEPYVQLWGEKYPGV